MKRTEWVNGLPGALWITALFVGLGPSLAAENAGNDGSAQSTGTAPPSADNNVFSKDNLVAWCIVPFDAKKRGPEERAQMLRRLGFRRLAYDWRTEHIPTFDRELKALKKHGIKLQAFWFPGDVNHPNSRIILDLLKRHKIRTQLWISMGGGGPAKTQEEQRKKIEAASRNIRSIAEEAAKIGCTVGLYNHGGWFGEPENQIAIIKQLGLSNVGIVYNLHHGHSHLERFGEMLRKMLPHLMAVNLNGMVKDGDKLGKKILPIGQGDRDLGLLRLIKDSGYRGPIGILGHRTDQDVEVTLRTNLDGLRRLVKELTERPSGPS